MTSELLFTLKDHRNLPWQIIDADKSDFRIPPLEEIIDYTGIIEAPWGPNGSRTPIIFHIALTFEGEKFVQGKRCGLFSIVVQPKDAAILRALTQRVGKTMSPRDYLKRVVGELAKHPMYPGARLDLIAAHYGARGGKRLFMQYAATAGWATLVARREAKIARFHARERAAGFLDKIVWWLFPDIKPTPPIAIKPEPPADPWRDSRVSELIENMTSGRGLDAGPLKMAGESLFRKMGRDPRLSRVMRPFERGEGTIMASDLDLSFQKRSNLTVVQLDDGSQS